MSPIEFLKMYISDFLAFSVRTMTAWHHFVTYLWNDPHSILLHCYTDYTCIWSCCRCRCCRRHHHHHHHHYCSGWRDWQRNKMLFGEITQRLGLLRHSRSSKVTEFCSYQKLICDLLVINSNLYHILHHFRDIAFERSKIAICVYPSCVFPFLSPTARFPRPISVKFYYDVSGWLFHQVA